MNETKSFIYGSSVLSKLQ